MRLLPWHTPSWVLLGHDLGLARLLLGRSLLGLALGLTLAVVLLLLLFSFFLFKQFFQKKRLFLKKWANLDL